ncbi:NAD-dependent epimerase/dehydratase family protein [uncultured Jatrophihabitans sp.]|uniref:NAD-dependent epimerase/dehydratase family protein n=1 Tax=uncultured Jatrophihabitans sp. TaxID=1610747 RepID=UPI0035C9661C
MRIVVTGATGNLGTALLRRLTTGEHEVVGVTRRPPPDTEPYLGLEWTRADLGEPDATDALAPAMAGAHAVVHLAFLLQPSHDRELMRRANQGGTRAVATAAERAGVRHLVHVSSIGTYAPATSSTPVDESWPNTGFETSPYSVDKAAAESILDDYEQSMTISRLRPTLVLQDSAASEISRYFLGPLIPPQLVRRSLLRLAPWPRELALQFVHSDDVAAAIDTVLSAGAGGAFNVAADPVIDRAAFATLFGGVGPALPPKLLRAVTDLTWRARIQPTDPGWVDLAIGMPLLDTSRLRALGWAPAHDGAEVLSSFVDALAAGRGGAGALLYPRGLRRKTGRKQ